MRRYDEPIEVKPGVVAGEEAPAQFLWRNRLWLVREIEDRWLETGDWWDGRAARAVRGEDSDPGSRQDLLAEQEIWRVIAAPGRSAEQGVCELAYASTTGEWRLRTVVD